MATAKHDLGYHNPFLLQTACYSGILPDINLISGNRLAMDREPSYLTEMIQPACQKIHGIIGGSALIRFSLTVISVHTVLHNIFGNIRRDLFSLK